MADSQITDSQLTQVNNLINIQIPSWNELFGQNSQCDCNECESMIGAPAYLARILNFTEKCTPNDNKETPYDILIRRAPYLPYLPLTCENTNTQIPYIQFVLEILEFYTATRDIKDMPAYDSGSDSWMNDYLLTAEKAYQKLSASCFPFALPYHQPLDVIRTYLSKLNTSYVELLRVFGSGDADKKLHIIKEYLSLSDEEYSLLTQFKIGDEAFDAFALYGFDTSADFQNAIYGVSEFLQRTGLLYVELIDLLRTQFVNPGINAVKFIESLFINGTANATPLFQQLKAIRDTNIDDALLAIIKNFLQQSVSPNIDPAQFKNWIDKHFDEFQNALIIIPGGDPCNYATSKLGTILSANDTTVQPPINDDLFKRLYFFIRLFRKTGYAINNLDNLLQSLSGKPNDKILEILSGVGMITKKISFTTGQVTSLYGNLNTTDDLSVYSSLFSNTALSKINENFRADIFGDYFTHDIALKSNDQYDPVLLSVLQLSAVQMDSLLKYLGIEDASTFNLSIESISVFYSYVLMAASLNLQLIDLLSLLTLFSQPEVLRSSWDKTTNTFKDAGLQTTLSFIEFIDTIKTSKFTIPELLFVLSGNANDVLVGQVTDDKVKQSVVALQQGFVNTDQQNPVSDKEPLIDGAFIKNKLLLLYDNNISLQLAGILNGKIIYGISLPDKPDLNIPAELLNKIFYNREIGRLQITGVLNSVDWKLIPDNIKPVLQPIFDKPFNFLKESFATFILNDDDRNKLLDRNDKITSDIEKYKSFYDLYQPYLVKKIKNKLLIQQIASLISLDERITDLISASTADELYTLVSKIISELLLSPEIYPVADVNDLSERVKLLYKSSLFISKFELSMTEVSFFINATDRFEKIDFKNFTFAQWKRLHNYVLLRRYDRSADFSFIDLFKLAATAGTTIQSIINMIVLLTEWAAEDITGLVSSANYKITDFNTEEKLYTISLMMQVVRKVNIKASKLITWIKTDTSFHALTVLAADIKNTLLQQYDDMHRDDTAMAIDANIWERQRDAHVAYILTLNQIKNVQGITNIDELCGYFLIDLPMNSCMLTTRIRQAISTVQSFIKRSQMKLEMVMVIDKETGEQKQVGVSPEQIDDTWEAMSLFRTWQVTMEFLINPYPYLSYQYLIEKSEAALTLEETLLKNDITQQTVSDSYRTYLTDLMSISNLEIATIYIDDIDKDNSPATKFIHVIGKSRSAPSSYYYCNKDEEDKWSFWRKIPVAIKENDTDSNGRSGAGVIFIKFKNRYYLFTPEFIKRHAANRIDNSIALSKIADQTTADQAKAKEYWEIQIGVCEYHQEKWGAKKYLNTSGVASLFQNLVTEPYTSGYFFTTLINKDDLILSLHNHLGTALIDFTFRSINSAIGLSTGSASTTPEAGIFYQSVKISNGPMEFPVGDHETSPQILKAGGEKFFNFSPQFATDLRTIYSQPFFFHDKDRSYYVTSSPANYTVQKQVEHDTIAPTGLQLGPSVIETIRNPEMVFYHPIHLVQLTNHNLLV